jgi:transcriptional regulator with GAF, ATPase, and Fis domain
MESDDFFRRATLLICGNLEIDKALQSILKFLKNDMPLDRVFLEYYDRNFKSMRTIATATVEACSQMDLLTPLSQSAQQSAKLTDLPDGRDVYIFEKPYERAISREMLEFHDVLCSSLMVMFLKSNEQMLGALVLITENDHYNQSHADLIALLGDPFAIATSNAIQHREVLKLKELLTDDNQYLNRELYRLSGDEIIGANFGLKEVMFHVRQVAPLDSPVLLSGETGVGKDVIAHAIHYSSSRSKGPFVSVNCGAIPDTLIDSELFGHEKGAFTGAIGQKRGRFERADKGTIFLDEIGELPLDAQVRLLRVLQSKEIERVGGDKTIHLDIRVIAATNRNLQELVNKELFREDLWFRLNVFPIWIPPLRERRADIPALLQHFIGQKSRELKLSSIPVISPDSMDLLMDYRWPGNVRELQNVVERALIINPRGPLTFDQIIPSFQAKKSSVMEMPEIISEKLDMVVSAHIRKVLSKTKGKVHGPGGAAELLGINASTLRNRMNKLKIRYKKSSD